jgi:iron complex outermembrane receptor protein
MAVRVVAGYWDSEAYYKNHFRFGFMVAPSFSWQISHNHKLVVKGEVMENHETNGTSLPLDPSVGSNGYAIIAKGLPRDFSFGSPNEDDVRIRKTERITAELLSTLSEHITSLLQPHSPRGPGWHERLHLLSGQRRADRLQPDPQSDDGQI